MVVCDACHRDPGTGKFFLLGLFSTIGALEFPCRHPSLVVFVSLTDGLGTFPLRLQLVHIHNEEESVFQQEQEISLDDPRIVVACVFQIAGLVIPEACEYTLKPIAHNEFLLERRVIVHSRKETGETHA